MSWPDNSAGSTPFGNIALASGHSYNRRTLAVGFSVRFRVERREGLVCLRLETHSLAKVR